MVTQTRNLVIERELFVGNKWKYVECSDIRKV